MYFFFPNYNCSLFFRISYIYTVKYDPTPFPSPVLPYVPKMSSRFHAVFDNSRSPIHVTHMCTSLRPLTWEACQEQHHPRVMVLSPTNCQLPAALSKECGLESTSPCYARITAGWVLCSSCEGNHSC